MFKIKKEAILIKSKIKDLKYEIDIIKIQKNLCLILTQKKEVKFLSQMLTPQFTTNFMMTFEVQEFRIQESKDNNIWKFKLGNMNNSQIDFFTQHESIRSLFHLSKDISHQIQTSIDRKKKKLRSKERVIRKLCEKIIKVLKLSLNSFANNVHLDLQKIEEELQTVKAYFQKLQLQEERSGQLSHGGFVHRIIIIRKPESSLFSNNKIIIQMSMDSSQFFKSCQKYVNTLFKDGKRISPDFQLLNELYVNIAGNQLKQETQMSQINSSNKILIDLNFTLEDKYISQMLLWDLQINSTAKINNFVQIFLADIIYQSNVKVDTQTFSDLRQQCIIQIKTQTLYKTLLKKHSNILLNFSTIETSQDIREYLIEINLKLSNENEQQFFQDSFQWDILNEQNNVEKFCQNLIQDQNIPSRYFSQLCYKIRTKINQQLQNKFDMLVKTFRSIHKDRESPKLNTQTMTQLKKNIIYTMDVGLTSNPDFNTALPQIVLNNSDLFSLLSRNIDILPEQFHEILMCKDTGKSVEKENKQKINKNTAQQYLNKIGCRVDDNGYLGNFTTNYRLHRIWSKQIGND